MAQGGQDLLSKLADRGEDVVGRISDIPGAQRLLEAAGSLKERVDDLQKKMRGLEALERRVEDDHEANDPREAEATDRRRRELGRHPQAQRAGYDLESYGRRSGLLAVELDRERRGRLDLDERAPEQLRLRVG